MNRIAATELKSRLDKSEQVFILDVRDPDEHENWHIPKSVNIPLKEIPARLGEIPKDREVVALCMHGPRSSRACQFLESHGYKVRLLEGGMIAWNTIYDIVEVPCDAADVFQLRRIGKGCVSYMLITGDKAAVIDPTIDTSAYMEAAQKGGAKISAVLDTHTHADHVSGGRVLADAAGAPYYSPDDSLSVKYTKVGDNSEIKAGAIIRAISTPGHTPESVTYLLDNLAFTGDTLFVESVGRPDLGQDPAPNAAILWRTLHNKILQLPDDTLILPAHYGEDVNLENTPITASLSELRSMTALNMPEEEFVKWICASKRQTPPNFEAIKRANRGLLDMQEDKLRDLEAGPNRCAVK